MTYRLLYLTRPYFEGEDVLAVQTRLRELGYDPYILDGVFGPLTEDAVVAFQRGRGLDPSGVVDRATYLALGWSLPEPGPEPPPGEPVGRPDAVSVVVDLALRQVVVYSVSAGRGLPGQAAGRGALGQASGRGPDPAALGGSPLAAGQVLRVYPCAIGKPATPSPVGNWHIHSKVIGPDWEVLGTRWMGLDVPWANYGLHGTNNPSSIGQAVSNGCIRLYNENVEELFDWAQIGTPVKITPEGG